MLDIDHTFLVCKVIGVMNARGEMVTVGDGELDKKSTSSGDAF
ncbi:hypothetical protein [Vibrio fluminensis]|nr:hypothetical protein [Vibrio fluminensis]